MNTIKSMYKAPKVTLADIVVLMEVIASVLLTAAAIVLITLSYPLFLEGEHLMAVYYVALAIAFRLMTPRG